MARNRIKRRTKRKTSSRKLYSGKTSIRLHHLMYGGLFALVVAIIVQFFFGYVGAKGQPGGSTGRGCEGLSNRPCYDKITTSGVNLLGKTGENSFTACTSNAAPNRTGEFIIKTPVCGQEKVTYCHDGKSNNFIRKFSGSCDSNPPPQPTPVLDPTPTGTPTSGNPFKIVAPNNPEQLPYGSQFSVKWEGGDPSPDWPIFLSIINESKTQALRELIISTSNDQQENWVVDLPSGNYVMYGQGCRFCLTNSQWDYSDVPFSVVSGAPIEKINTSNPLNQSLVVLSASGGETWGVGSGQTIKWSGGTNDWTIRVSLIDNNNSSTYTTIFQGIVNDGTEPWSVPEYIPPGSYKTYVSCTNCPSAPSGYTGGYYAYSFNPFTIK